VFGSEDHLMKHMKNRHDKKYEKYRMKAIKSFTMDNFAADKEKLGLLPSQIYK
jgi:hypothetical protein